MVQSQGEKIHLSIYCVQQRRLSGGLTKISRTMRSLVINIKNRALFMP